MLLPYNVDRPARITPYVTYGLMAINTLIFLWTVLIAFVNLPADRVQGKSAIHQLMVEDRTQARAEIRRVIEFLRRQGRDVPAEPTDEMIDSVLATLDEAEKKELAEMIAMRQANDVAGYSRFWQITHSDDTYVMEPHYSVLNIFAYRPAERSFSGKILGLLCSMFLHGSLMHLLGNMLFLWVFGRALEDALGPRIYIGSYLVCGVAATLLFHIITMRFMPESAGLPLMGASGAIAGVMGLFAVRFYRTPVRVLFLPVLTFFAAIATFIWYLFLGDRSLSSFLGLASAVLFNATYGRRWKSGTFRPAAAWILGIYLVISDIFPALRDLITRNQTGGVAHWAHIGGFGFGMLYAMLISSQAEGATEYLLEDAQKALDDKDATKAITCAQNLLAREPHNADAQAVLAKAYDRLRNEEAALDNYEAAINNYLKSGQRDAAVLTYLSALEQHPLFILTPAVQLALGSQMAKSNDYRHAAETIVKIPYTFPEAPEGEVSLLRSGQLYLHQLDEPQVALQLFETFLERYPHSPWVPQAEQSLAASCQKIAVVAAANGVAPPARKA